MHLSLKNIPQCPLTRLPPTPEQSLQLPGYNPKKASRWFHWAPEPGVPSGQQRPKGLSYYSLLLLPLKTPSRLCATPSMAPWLQLPQQGPNSLHPLQLSLSWFCCQAPPTHTLQLGNSLPILFRPAANTLIRLAGPRGCDKTG